MKKDHAQIKFRHKAIAGQARLLDLPWRRLTTVSSFHSAFGNGIINQTIFILLLPVLFSMTHPI